MSNARLKLGILCDTGFLIRLNQPHDPLHINARGYLKYLLAGDHLLYVSTIALAEYAVRDKIENLPLKYFRVLPFNIEGRRVRWDRFLTAKSDTCRNHAAGDYPE